MEAATTSVNASCFGVEREADGETRSGRTTRLVRLRARGRDILWDFVCGRERRGPFCKTPETPCQKKGGAMLALRIRRVDIVAPMGSTNLGRAVLIIRNAHGLGDVRLTPPSEPDIRASLSMSVCRSRPEVVGCPSNRANDPKADMTIDKRAPARARSPVGTFRKCQP
jgi:hypothetical protein